MRVVLGLGGNLGDREKTLGAAVDRLAALEGTRVLRLSRLYETAPFDTYSPQGPYLNRCALIETALPPEDLLDRCLAIEAALGRVRLEYHGARTIDIDVLLCQGYASQTKKLTVPHPGIRQRAFVLVPLADLFPDKNAWGFDFRADYEAVDKSGVFLVK